MSKGERNRAARRDGVTVRGPGSDGTGFGMTIGRGRPRGAARARTRAVSRPAVDVPVNPWQGYGNAIVLGKTKIARWKTGETKNRVKEMDSYLAGITGSGQLKTLDDVVQVRERDDRERMLK